MIDDLEAWVERRPNVALVLIERMVSRLGDAGVDHSDGGRVEQFERLEQLRLAATSANTDPQG